MSTLSPSSPSRWYANAVMAFLAVALLFTSFDRTFRSGGPVLLTLGNKNFSVSDIKNLIHEEHVMNSLNGEGASKDFAFLLGTVKNHLLMDLEVKNLAIHISENAAKNSLMSRPLFEGQRGQFDMKKMKTFLAEKQITLARLVACERQHMARTRLKEVLKHQVNTPYGLKDLIFKGFFQKRSGFYKVFPAVSGKSVEPNDQEMFQLFRAVKPETTPQRSFSIFFLTCKKDELEKIGQTLRDDINSGLDLNHLLRKNAALKSRGILKGDLVVNEKKIFHMEGKLKGKLWNLGDALDLENGSKDALNNASISQEVLNKVFQTAHMHTPDMVWDKEGRLIIFQVDDMKEARAMTYEEAKPVLIETYNRIRFMAQAKERAELFLKNPAIKEMKSFSPISYQEKDNQVPWPVQEVIFSPDKRQVTADQENAYAVVLKEIMPLAEVDGMQKKSLDLMISKGWSDALWQLYLYGLGKKYNTKWHWKELQMFLSRS